MKNYQDIDLEIIFFAEQDVVTASQLYGESYADEQQQGDIYTSEWFDDWN